MTIVEMPAASPRTHNGADIDEPHRYSDVAGIDVDDPRDDGDSADLEASPLMMQIAYGAALLIEFVIGTASFILSFYSLSDMGARAGYPHRLSPLLPVIIDGTIVLATLAILALRRHKDIHGDKLRFFWWMLAVSALVSMGSNGLELFLPKGQPLPPWLAAVFGVLPPLSLLADTHGASLLASVRPSTLKPRPRHAPIINRRNKEQRRTYWQQIAHLMLDDNPNSKAITERPVEVLTDVLYRHHELHQSGRAICDATDLHHSTLKKILTAGAAAQQERHLPATLELDT